MANNITITGSANSTPPAGTVVATCQLASGVHVQQFGLTDGANLAVVDAASRLLTATCVVNAACVIVSSGSLVVTNGLSASLSGGSVALLAGANIIGAASVIQGVGAGLASPWAVKLSDGTDSAAITSASEQLVFVNNSPSVIVSSGSLVVTNALSASLSGGSVALLAGANVVGSASVIQGVGAAITAPWSMRLGDGVNGVAVTGASLLQVDGSGTTASRIISSGSITVLNQVSASLSGGSVALLAGANMIGSASVLQGIAACPAAAWPVRLSDLTDTVSVTAASELMIFVNNSPSIVVSSGSLVVTNVLSASLSGGSLALLAGTNVIGSASVIQSTPTGIGNAWPTKITDGVDGAAVTSASELLVNIGNSPSVVVSSGSVVVTNALSASISNTLAASAIQGTPNSVGNAWPMKITDGVDTAAINSSSQLSVAVSAASVNIVDTSGNQYGISSASPLYVTGGAGGTSAVDKAAYAEGTTNFTPVGGFFSANPVALTACQGGAVRATANRALHANLRDANGNELGTGAASPLIVQIGDGVDLAVVDAASRLLTSACVVNSPSVIISSGSLIVTNGLSASLSGGSIALLAGANVVGSASVIQSTGLGIGAAWSIRITDTADSAAVTAASELLVNVNNSPSVVVASGSMVVTNSLTASISGGSVALLSGANVIGSASAIQGAAAAITSPWAVKLSDSTDSAAITAASEVLIFVNNSPSVIVSSGSLVVTNALSASLSGGSVALLAGANVIGSASVIQGTAAAITSPWAVRLSDGTDSAIITSTSLLQVDASGTTASRIVTSGSVTVINQVSASVSGGSAALLAGTNVIGSASVIQSTPTGVANAWPIYLATSTGSLLGRSGSPLVVANDQGNVALSGSVLSVCSVNVSSSAAACTIIVGGCAGFFIRVIAATYTTSNSQNIGWIAGSAASALLQSPMPFAQFGGMDVNRWPHGYLWQGGNGCALIMTTTSACIVAGNLNWILVPA